MWIAELRESSRRWTQMALVGYPTSVPVWVSVHSPISSSKIKEKKNTLFSSSMVGLGITRLSGYELGLHVSYSRGHVALRSFLRRRAYYLKRRSFFFLIFPLFLLFATFFFAPLCVGFWFPFPPILILFLFLPLLSYSFPYLMLLGRCYNKNPLFSLALGVGDSRE